MIRFYAVFCGVFLATGTSAEVVKMAVTTSFENAGLADVMLPAIDAALDIQVQLLVVGTGQALRLGAAGDVDAVLVHARAAEQAFVTAGYGKHRREIMYNDFVLVGPGDDPAGVRHAKTAAEALQALAGAPFVSRGDDSGTHQAELALWAAADIVPQGAWYRAVGAGMGAALNTAAGLDAYVMTDRASWIKFGNKGDLALLFEGDPALFNQYSFIPVAAGEFDHIPVAAVAALEAWLTGAEAAALINGYQVAGQSLFTFNATNP